MSKLSIVYAYQLSSYIKKNAFYTSGLNYPVIALDCNSYKTGKHGHGKTTLLLSDFFTEKAFPIILDTDHPFYFMEGHPTYQCITGSITKLHVDKDKERYNADLLCFNAQGQTTELSNTLLSKEANETILEYLLNNDIKINGSYEVPDQVELEAKVIKWPFEKELKLKIVSIKIT